MTEKVCASMEPVQVEMDRLRQERAALLDACKYALLMIEGKAYTYMAIAKLRAAIAKAEGREAA